MKRGLVVLDPAEIPETEWSERVTRLQERMSAEGVSLALVYGDVFRSDDIGYLTNLCIYWNEGIVAVPAQGDPVFLAKLSPRVHTWMRATSTVSDLRSGKTFGQLVRGLVEGREPGVLGLVDGQLWPKAAVDEVIGAASPGWEVRLLGGLVRRQRLVPSDAELQLLRDGAHLLGQAVTAASAAPSSTEQVAVVEREARGAGFTDLMPTVSTTSEGVTSLEVTGEYRHGWVHVARVTDPGSRPAWLSALQQALEATLGAVAGGARVSTLTPVAADALGVLPPGCAFNLRCVNQADMATEGEYDTRSSMDVLDEGSVVVVGLELIFADGGRAAVAETVLVVTHGAELLSAGTRVASSTRRPAVVPPTSEELHA